MRLRHAAGGLAVVLAGTLGGPAAAGAAAASTLPPLPHQAGPAAQHAAASPIPWKPYHTKPWHDAPGKVCAFGVRVTIVRQREQYRTLSSYPDGKPRLQEFRGPLFVRYANTSSGKSVTGNLSGYGWFYYPRAGGADALAASHIGVTVPAGNEGFPAGEWVVNGQAEVIISSSGTINIWPFHATVENICARLS